MNASPTRHGGHPGRTWVASVEISRRFGISIRYRDEVTLKSVSFFSLCRLSMANMRNLRLTCEVVMQVGVTAAGMNGFRHTMSLRPSGLSAPEKT